MTHTKDEKLTMQDLKLLSGQYEDGLISPDQYRNALVVAIDKVNHVTLTLLAIMISHKGE